jgi:hypothetical protein
LYTSAYPPLPIKLSEEKLQVADCSSWNVKHFHEVFDLKGNESLSELRLVMENEESSSMLGSDLKGDQLVPRFLGKTLEGNVTRR